MDKEIVNRSLKEASACIRKFEAESKALKAKVAQADNRVAELEKEAEATKIAFDMVLDESTKAELEDKIALLKTKDLGVVKAALELDITTKSASLGDLSDSDATESSPKSPLQAFMAVLSGNK